MRVSVLSWFLAASTLGVASSASAFFEDLCIDSSVTPYKWKNCVNKCDPTVTANCGAAVAANVAQNNLAAPPAGVGAPHSTYHIDETYNLAVALGYLPQVAYWLAAYDEATDIGLFKPMTKCGKEIADATLYPIDLSGLTRTNNFGGSLFHLSTAFANTAFTDTTSDTGRAATAAANEHAAQGVNGYFPLGRGYPSSNPSTATTQYDWTTKVPGAVPDTTTIYEGTTYAARAWALQTGSSYKLCNGGYTTSSTINGKASLFASTSCYTSGVPITGESLGPGLQVAGSTGLAPLQVTCDSNGQCTVTATTADLASKLAAGTGRISLPSAVGSTLNVQSTVPHEIARMGIYLHILQDRISHSAYCANVKGTFNQLITSNGAPAFAVGYMATCDVAPNDAMNHMFEYGTEQGNLPTRSFLALSNTFDELVFFARLMKAAHPTWFASSAVAMKDNATIASLKAKTVGKVKGSCTEKVDAPYTDASGNVWRNDVSECWAANNTDTGIVTNPLRYADPTKRMSEFANVQKTLAIAPMPGWESSVSCE